MLLWSCTKLIKYTHSFVYLHLHLLWGHLSKDLSVYFLIITILFQFLYLHLTFSDLITKTLICGYPDSRGFWMARNKRSKAKNQVTVWEKISATFPQEWTSLKHKQLLKMTKTLPEKQVKVMKNQFTKKRHTTDFKSMKKCSTSSIIREK